MKVVNLVTTIHNFTTFQKKAWDKDGQNHQREVMKPCSVELYTCNMGGVDQADRAIWTYLHTHKTLKWWKKIFMYMAIL